MLERNKQGHHGRRPLPSPSDLHEGAASQSERSLRAGREDGVCRPCEFWGGGGATGGRAGESGVLALGGPVDLEGSPMCLGYIGTESPMQRRGRTGFGSAPSSPGWINAQTQAGQVLHKGIFLVTYQSSTVRYIYI